MDAQMMVVATHRGDYGLAQLIEVEKMLLACFA
jgi:hypothetical protein